jgi:hypothetical protein
MSLKQELWTVNYFVIYVFCVSHSDTSVICYSLKGLLIFIEIGQILRSSTLMPVYADNKCHQTHCTSFQQFICIFLCSWYLKAFVCNFIILIDCRCKLTYNMPFSTSLPFEVLQNTRHMPKRKSHILSFATFSVLNYCLIFMASS